MSIHKTLFIGGALEAERTVWTRRERLDALKKEGRWSDEESVFGLPKVRTKYKVLTRKQIKAKEAAVEEQEAEATAEGQDTAAEPTEA